MTQYEIQDTGWYILWYSIHTVVQYTYCGTGYRLVHTVVCDTVQQYVIQYSSIKHGPQYAIRYSSKTKLVRQ